MHVFLFVFVAGIMYTITKVNTKILQGNSTSGTQDALTRTAATVSGYVIQAVSFAKALKTAAKTKDPVIAENACMRVFIGNISGLLLTAFSCYHLHRATNFN